MTKRRFHSYAKLGAFVAMLAMFAMLALGSVLVSASSSSSPASASLGAIDGLAVPLDWQIIETQAVTGCPSIPWSVLGALGWIASHSGRSSPLDDAPWWHWPGGLFGVDAFASIDALASLNDQASNAVAVLCRIVQTGSSLEQALNQVIGDPLAVLQVNVVATSLDVSPDLSAGRASVVEFAAGALGLPYQWGGNGPSSYDCSGLVVAAFHAAGISLPRTAQEQHDVTALVSGNGDPGDLVFFGGGPDDISHVGIEIGDQLMIDAPETGAFVRIENQNWSDLVSQGSVSS